MKVAEAEYPAVKVYRQGGEGTETRDVCSEAFGVELPVVASAGPHELRGTLTYQALDKAACYPPKTLPLRAVFTAR